jgi:hypothetical protein
MPLTGYITADEACTDNPETVMAMNAIERKAAFRYAATVRELTMCNAARRLGVSYNHLMLVLAGPEEGGRQGSAALMARIAEFIGCSVVEAFTPPSPLSFPAPKGDITLN